MLYEDRDFDLRSPPLGSSALWHSLNVLSHFATMTRRTTRPLFANGRFETSPRLWSALSIWEALLRLGSGVGRAEVEKAFKGPL